jgi:hypothetical protein
VLGARVGQPGGGSLVLEIEQRVDVAASEQLGTPVISSGT